MYLITLEAWRRGLEVTYFLEKNKSNRLLIRYELSDGEKTYKFNSSLGEKVTEEAYLICNNKQKTKEVLEKNNIPVPKGKLINLDDSQEIIINDIKKLKTPWVVKPLSENTGKGVYTDIKTNTDLFQALDSIRNMGHNEAIVEEQIDGTEYRVLVLGDKVLAAVKREPANIIGNGESTIEELIQFKNKKKDENPNLYHRYIEIDDEIKKVLKDQGYTLSSVPDSEEKIFLRNKVTLEGDPIDATETIPEILKEISIKAVKAVPGLDMCGLDIMISTDGQSVRVIELNTRPMLGLHVFPFKGTPRDVIAPIIEHYFPENKNKGFSNLYFDMNRAISPIREGVTTRVTLSRLPSVEQLIVLKITLKNVEFEKKSILNNITLKAKELNINGSMNERKGNKWELMLGNLYLDKIEEFIQYIQIIVGSDTVSMEIEEMDRGFPVNIGFKVNTISRSKKTIEKIKKQNKKITKKNKKLEKNLKKSQKQQSLLISQLELLKKEKKNLEKELSDIKSSNSWKITKPLRTISTKMKK